MHPLVEIFVDDQLEPYLVEEKETNAPLPPLIGQVWSPDNEGWGDQDITERTLTHHDHSLLGSGFQRPG